VLIWIQTSGRHAIAVAPQAASDTKYLTPPSTSTLKQTLHGLWRMFSAHPYWDISYLVAVVFTWGSVIWCINAFFVWLPLQVPSSEFKDEITYGGGITAFIGATVFEFGSVLLMMEAVNENRAGCFGWALEAVLEDAGVIRLKPGECMHHHQNKGNLVGKGKGTCSGGQFSNCLRELILTSRRHLAPLHEHNAKGWANYFPPYMDVVSDLV
jgi:hypothetical protein